MLIAARRHRTPAQPPQILPAALAMHALSGSRRNPSRDFGACPGPAVRRWILDRLAELTPQILRKDWRYAHVALPSIRQARWPILAIALDDLPDGSWAVACCRHNLGLRRTVGQQADDLPAPAFGCS